MPYFYFCLVFLLSLSTNTLAQVDTVQTPSKKQVFNNTLAVGTNIAYLGIDKQVGKEFSAEYSRKTGIGMFIGRLGYTERFGNKGTQMQAEYYPLLWKKAYAHLVFAYSPQNAYPKIATGFTIIQSLKGGFEAELGTRFYQSKQNENVVALILGANKYIGQGLLMYKLWLVKTPTKNEQAHNLQMRYYGKDEKSYILGGLLLGNATQTNNGGQFAFDTPNNITLSIQAGFSKHFAKRYNLSSLAFYEQTKYGNSNIIHRMGLNMRMAVSF